jgi:hypothetical protein
VKETKGKRRFDSRKAAHPKSTTAESRCSLSVMLSRSHRGSDLAAVGLDRLAHERSRGLRR